MSDVEEIKSRLHIIDIVGKRVTLKKAGRNFKGLCPFHNEKTPSFIVSPDRQTFHCFGCAKGGDIFTFVMEYDHVDFPEALEELASQAGVTLTRTMADTPQAKIKDKILEVNHLASEYYHYILTKHALGEHARQYLKNRGISEKSIKTFTLGYSPNSWDGLLKYLIKKGYDGKLLENAGLVIQKHNQSVSHNSDFYDRFRGRVMFTLKDHRGHVVGFAGRVLKSDEKEAKYINTPETPVYIKGNVLYGLDVTKAVIQKENEAVVMEGELDVISSFQAGIGNVVAIKGSALTEGHVHLLRRFTESVTFALDSDLAGDAAARRGIELADKAGLDLKVVVLPSGKDPDEAARESPALLKKAVKDAIPVYDYFLSSSLKRHDAATAIGKKKISTELLPVFAKIDNAIVQGHYVKKLAKLLETSEETLMDAMRKMTKSSGFSSRVDARPDAGVKTRQDKLEVYLLALILQGNAKERFGEFTSHIAISDITQLPVAKILTHLSDFLASRPFEIAAFADVLPKELLPTLDEAFLWDIGDIADQADRMAHEWAEALRSLELAVAVAKLAETGRKLQNSDLSDEESKRLHDELQLWTDRRKRLEKSV